MTVGKVTPGGERKEDIYLETGKSGILPFSTGSCALALIYSSSVTERADEQVERLLDQTTNLSELCTIASLGAPSPSAPLSLDSLTLRVSTLLLAFTSCIHLFFSPWRSSGTSNTSREP